jgi:hypothetical protein
MVSFTWPGELVIGGTVIDHSGHISLKSGATVWEDLREPLNGDNLYSAPGKADFDWTELAVTFDPSGSLLTDGDVIAQTYQLPHSTKLNSILKLHIHWWQTDSVSRQFTWKYRLQSQGSSKSTAWSSDIIVNTDSSNSFAYVSGAVNQATRLGNIDITGLSLSAMVQIKLTRTDAVAGKLFATYLDLHYEIDSLGSNTEFTK